jgi:hypothetical protein
MWRAPKLLAENYVKGRNRLPLEPFQSAAWKNLVRAWLIRSCICFVSKLQIFTAKIQQLLCRRKTISYTMGTMAFRWQGFVAADEVRALDEAEVRSFSYLLIGLEDGRSCGWERVWMDYDC